jgi:hypothetical protein
MYGDIKKPFLLKDIPSVLLRSLPAIYYFSKYFNHTTPYKTKTLFKTNAMFLSNALNYLGEKWNADELKHFSDTICKMSVKPYKSLIHGLENEIIGFAKFCSTHRTLIKERFCEVEHRLHKLYQESVTKLQIFLFNPNGDYSTFDKVESNLYDFCDYSVLSSNPLKNHFSDNMLNSDFVVFLSIYDKHILDDIKYIDIYSRPGLALGPGNFDQLKYREAEKNSGELAKKGIKVIYKMYSPIRLYTTIDKLYLQYHLKPE